MNIHVIRIHQIDVSTREVARGDRQTGYVAEARGVHSISRIGDFNVQIRQVDIFPLADEGEAKQVVVGKGGFCEMPV